MIAALAAAVAALGLGTSPCWAPPVAAPVAVPFKQPACRWCPGHRGVTYEVAPGTPVAAVESGTVTFAGAVAGRRYVVVQHAGGVRATYGGLATIAVAAGEVVAARQVVGTSEARVHFGLRDGDEYLDPVRFLGEWRSRARLVPTDGTPARAGPPPRLVCPAG